jgi:hypothetical protein
MFLVELVFLYIFVEVVWLCATIYVFGFCFTSNDSVHKFGYPNCLAKVNDKGDGIEPSIYTLRLGCNIWCKHSIMLWVPKLVDVLCWSCVH